MFGPFDQHLGRRRPDAGPPRPSSGLAHGRPKRESRPRWCGSRWRWLPGLGHAVPLHHRGTPQGVEESGGSSEADRGPPPVTHSRNPARRTARGRSCRGASSASGETRSRRLGRATLLARLPRAMRTFHTQLHRLVEASPGSGATERGQSCRSFSKIRGTDGKYVGCTWARSGMILLRGHATSNAEGVGRGRNTTNWIRIANMRGASGRKEVTPESPSSEHACSSTAAIGGSSGRLPVRQQAALRPVRLVPEV